jgi:hypothetical protein
MSVNGQQSTPLQQVTANEASRPRLIFMAEAQGAALLHLLGQPGALDILAGQGYSVALGLSQFSDDQVAVARMLNVYGVPLVAWLMLPTETESAFNAQNYPQAAEHYHAFRTWSLAHDLRFEAIGFEIAPSVAVLQREESQWRRIVDRLNMTRENALYPAARTAYANLVEDIHQDGYEVHTYQIPLIADDRRAGTTVAQRALEIVDIPSDLDVLMCSSSVPIERLGGDLGGALIAAYGPAADAIGIGGMREDPESDEGGVLPWPAIHRDLLLAAQHTDTIYIDSLEGCIERGLLPMLADINWHAPASVEPRRSALVIALRWLLCAALITSRFGLRVLGVAGWVLAAVLWLRGRRGAKMTR